MRISRRDTLRLGLGAGAALTVLANEHALAQQGPQTVTFLLTNDIYEMNEEKGRGGFPKLAAVVKAEKAKNPNVVFTHGGDTLSPSLMSGFTQGAHMIDLFNALPPDALVPGNHEFDFGKDVFLKRMGESKFPWVAANIRNADGSQVKGLADTLMLERGGIKIGIAGAALETTGALSSPGDLKFAPAVATLRTQAKALRDAGADFVVALVHTDRTTDLQLFDAKFVDLILTGHDHDLRVVYDGKIAMVESGEDSEYVVAVDVKMNLKVDGNKRTLTWDPSFRIIDTATITPDPDMLAKVKVYEAELSKELDVPVGTLGVELDSRTASVRSQETAIGNLIADALKAATGADVAITNGGGIRANKQYPVGATLTRRDILSELPFGNRTSTTEITGAALKAAIENGLSQIENRAGRFPQVSGLVIEANATAPAGKRITSIMVNGAPLDEAKTYKVATNDFMLRGGDGYTSLAGKVTATVDSGGSLMANDVMAYVRKVGTVTTKVEGRVVLK
jgi:2',3'-cyclic-nucleotide 2'-phosphodiesterase (5'-nucleotidase family)